MSQSIIGQQIDGIWHTGIVVYEKEYYFGGGIQVTPWGHFASMNGMQPTEVRSLGHTTKSQAELETHLRTVNHLYTQMTYDLISHNCNNFSDTISRFLLGQGIPSYIIDLPRIVFSTPGGAMLRPMIESMQNNVRQQQGFSFAASTDVQPSAAQGQRFETALSESVTSLVMNIAQQSGQQTVKAQLEEKAWVSADATSVVTLSNKILNLSDSNGNAGAALSEEEKERLRRIVSNLQQRPSPVVAATEPPFTVEDYTLMEHILASHPEAHMACLFLVRLMFLHDRMTDFKELRLVRQILSRLLIREGSEAMSEPGKPSGFATIPAHAMALCAMSNLLSHEAGLTLLSSATAPASLAETTGSLLSADLVSDLIDTVLSGLSHGRAEVRQMSATLAYNLTLACTRGGALSGPWKPADQPTAPDLNSQAMQLLCGCLEGIAAEEVSRGHPS